MLKKRFSTTLLALVVAAVIPGSVFAADVASESTGEVSAPTSVSEPGSSEDEAANVGSGPATSGSTEADTNGSPDADNSSVGGADVVDSAQQEGDSDQDAEAVFPKEDSEGEQTPDVIEPDPEGEGDEIAAPEVNEPEAEAGDETGVIDDEQDVEGETPVVKEEPAEEIIQPEIPVVEPELIPEEVILPVEEVVVTEAAIVVEPVAATLTITHRLIVGDEYDDMDQTFDGFEVGQTVDLADYVVNAENVVCISNLSELTLDEENDMVVLEYNFTEIPDFKEHMLEK